MAPTRIRILAGSERSARAVPSGCPCTRPGFPGHFAEDTIRAVAVRLRRFLNQQGAIIEDEHESLEHA